MSVGVGVGRVIAVEWEIQTKSVIAAAPMVLIR